MFSLHPSFFVLSLLSRSRMPLTKAGDPAEPNRRASSMDSSRTTLAGVSVRCSNSNAPRPQDIAIDDGHARNAPVVGGAAQEGINGLGALADAIAQGQGERFQVGVAQPLVDESLDGLTRDARVEIVLEEQLQGHLAGSGSFSAHGRHQRVERNASLPG